MAGADYDYDNRAGRHDDASWLGRFRRVSFRAVVAGAIVAVSVQLLFSMLGLAIGAWAFEPTTDDNPGEGFATATGIYWLITSVISMAIGGWVAGWASSTRDKVERGLHGVLAWSVVTLLTFYLLSSAAGGLLNATAHAVSQTAAGIAAGGASAAANRAADVATDPNARRRAEEAANDASENATDVANRAQAAVNDPETRQAIARTAEQTADYVSGAALWSFLAMLLSLAAAFGAAMAAETDRRTNGRTDTASGV